MRASESKPRHRGNVTSIAVVFVTLVVVVLSGACSSSSQDEESTKEQSDGLHSSSSDAGACRAITLRASRTLFPRRIDDDQRALVPPMRFRLPAEVRVVDGPSIYRWATLSHRFANENTITCWYKRIGLFSAQRYGFKACSKLSEVANQIVRADSVKLHVGHSFGNGGDPDADDDDDEQHVSHHLTETVEVTFREEPPCGADAGISDASMDASDADASSSPDAGDEDGGEEDDAGGGVDSGPVCIPADCNNGTGDTCTVHACTAAGCVHTPRPDGTSCSDGNVCTLGDVCSGGVCQAGVPVDPSDSSPCTIDTCDPVLGILHVPAPAGAPCPNANLCDGAERCDGDGACIAGTPAVVDDNNPCTDDACDPTSGVRHTPRPAGDTICSDQDACNGVESCDGAGACRTGAPPVIDDGNVCTADSCSPITGPVHTPIAGCDPTPTPSTFERFETRASILGKLVTKSGSPITNASFTVWDERKSGGAPRSDLAVTTAGDGSFRIRLTSFPESEPTRSPPHRLVVDIESVDTIPAQRIIYAHPGDAEDLGTIRLIARDPAVTLIGPAGGTATDSRNRIQVDVPPGALTTTVPIQITPFDEREDFPNPLPDITMTMYGMDLAPSGTTFTTPVTVRIANTLSLPTTLEIPTGRYNETEGQWDHVDTARWDGSRFTFRTSSFSRYDSNSGRAGELVLIESFARSPNLGGGVCGAGSTWRSSGGSIDQSFTLPSVQAAGESVGVTLNYTSGLAGSRKLGESPASGNTTPPGTPSVVPRGTLAISMEHSSSRTICVDNGSGGSGGGGGGTTGEGACSTSIGSCAPGAIRLNVDVLLLQQQATLDLQTPPNATQFDTGAWVDVPLTASGTPVATSLITRTTQLLRPPRAAGATSSCAGSGGAFGVSDPSRPRVTIPEQGGPAAVYKRKVLLHHRFTSPYGAGWAIEEASRLYTSGDYGVLVHGNGQEEQFRPRARVREVPPAFGDDIAFARDEITGELFTIEQPNGVLKRLDAATGVRTPLFGALAIPGPYLGLAATYIGGTRHFVVADVTGFYDVDGAGARRTVLARAITGGSPTPYRRFSIAARGSDLYFTEARPIATGQPPVDPVLWTIDLASPAAVPVALSKATDGIISINPLSNLGAVQFTQPNGLAFAPDNSLYLADSRRHVVYRILPSTDGRITQSSPVEIAVGDGNGRQTVDLGNQTPARGFSINQPTHLAMTEDGHLLITNSFGLVAYDRLAREAELLFVDGRRDEIRATISGVFQGSSGPVSIKAPNVLGLTKRTLYAAGGSLEGLLYVEVDLLSSRTDPTRTIVREPDGSSVLTDTTQAITQRFDRTGRLIEQRRRTGEIQYSVTYADSDSDRISFITNAAGGRFQFAYANGKLTSITDPAGAVTNVAIDAQGDLTSIVEPEGETYALAYDAHHMTSKTTPRGEITKYTYAENGTVATSEKPGGELYTLQASLAGPQVYRPDGTVEYTASYIDARGVTHTIDTNDVGGTDRETFVADGVTYVNQAVYPALLESAPGFGIAEPPVAVRANKIFRASHHTLNGASLSPPTFFDSLGRPVLARRTTNQGLGGFNVTQWAYDANGWLSRQHDVPDASLAQVIERDAAGHILRIFDEGVSGASTGREARFTWRADGQPATSTVHGVTTTFTYDDASGGSRNLIGTSDTLGRTSTMAYDARGNVASTSDGTASAAFELDAHNRLRVSRDGLGFETSLRYTHEACGCSEQDLVTGIHTPDLAAGLEWTFEYGDQGRLKSVTDPQGFKEAYTYEPTGELTSVLDRLNRSTSMTHDQLGRLKMMTDTLGRSHGRTYSVPTGGAWSGPTLTNASGDSGAAPSTLTSSLRSGEYQSGVNALDIEGYPAKIELYRDATFALGYTLRRDQVGRLLSRYDRTDRSIESTDTQFFNDVPRTDSLRVIYNSQTSAPLPSSIQSPTTSGITFTDARNLHNFEFDTIDRTGFAFADRIAITHDAGGRPLVETHDFCMSCGVSGASNLPPHGFGSSTYAYRPDGRMGRVVDADGTHDYAYDARGQVSSCAIVSSDGEAEGTYAFSYDEMGRNTLINYPDGHRREQRYDELGRIVERCYRYPTPASADHCYGAEYDAVGNIVRLMDPEGEDVVTVDALDRITRVTRAGAPDETYEYNALGALKTNAGLALDTQRPRLLGGGVADSAIAATLGGQPVALDAGGRVTKLRDQTLRWSNLSTLHSVIGAAAPTITFGLDDQTRRVWQFNGAPEGYIYEGANRVATLAIRHLLPPVDTDVTYVRDAWFFEGVDHPLRWRHKSTDESEPPQLAYYELDLAGNVRRLRSPNGADLGGYRYTAFGKTLSDSASLDQPLRWKARWHYNFGATEIYDIRARQWCPELGAFLSVDNYAFHDARSTLWGWPSQNPIRWRDPSGHDPFGGGEAVVESQWDATSADRQSWDYGRGLGVALALQSFFGMGEISAASESGALVRFYDAARKLALGITGGGATAASASSKTQGCSASGGDAATRAINAARAACPGGDCRVLSEEAKKHVPGGRLITILPKGSPPIDAVAGVFKTPVGLHQAVILPDGRVADPLLNTTFASVNAFLGAVINASGRHEIFIEGQVFIP